MSDTNPQFHQFALQSGLFKGRNDWYFCFLKSEKIAHVLTVLADSSYGQEKEVLSDLSYSAARVPQSIVYFAAGDNTLAKLLADLFSILSMLRLAGTSRALTKENCAILIHEYEVIAEKLGGESRLSPSLSSDDLGIEDLPAESPVPLLSGRLSDASFKNKEIGAPSIKDIKDNPNNAHAHQHTKGQQDRAIQILDLVRKNKNVSIKDISAVIRDCSEKTIQRELNVLIQQGLVKKVGERRWSHYIPR